MRRGSLFSLLVPALALGLASRASAAAEDDVAAAVGAALTAASSIEGARVEVLSVDRPRASCTLGMVTRAEVSQPVEGSARLAVKLIGVGKAPCEAWTWVRFRLLARVPVATRAVRAGDALSGATRLDEREIKPGHAPADAAAIDAGATADRTLGAGQAIEADAVRAPGPRAGETLKVVVLAGSLAVEQTGRAVPCARNRNCAVLPSGRHVEGRYIEGRLLVEMP